jgi:hypothetical protein
MLVVRLPARGWRMVRPIVTVLTAWQRSCPRPFDSPSIVRLIPEALFCELHSFVVDTLRVVNHARCFATKSVGLAAFQYSRSTCNSLGESGTKRSLFPFPLTILICIRWESIC